MDRFTEFMFNTDYGLIGLWLIFILLQMGVDVFTGFIQAIINKDLKSGKMSTGLLKKSAI